MRPVERHGGAVAVHIGTRHDGGTTVVAGVAAEAHRLRPGVSHVHLEAVGKTAGELGLERIVAGVAEGFHQGGLDVAPKLAEEGTSGCTRADDLAGVQIHEIRLFDGAVGHITGLQREAFTQLTLDGEVPAGDVSALEPVTS